MQQPVGYQAPGGRTLERGETVIALGIILLVLGFLFGVGILWTLGIILIVVGAILWILGAIGRPVAGRTHYY